MLQRLVDMGIVVDLHGRYVFYRDEVEVFLGANNTIASNTIYYYPELFARYYNTLKEGK